MITETIKATDKEGIRRAAELIRRGETVAFPTETVYGLGANAFDGAAVAKIFEAKGRPADNPLIVHIENINMLYEIAVGIPDDFYALYEKFMPGPLTVILHRSKRIGDAVTAGLDTVAVRFPRHRTAVELIKTSGLPLAAPSANLSEHVSPTSAAHVLRDLGGRIPMIVDGGECTVGIESTVLDMTNDVPVVLRPGAVTLDMLKKVLPSVTDYRKDVTGGEIIQAKSPGMKYRHYSPNAELYLVKTPADGIALYDGIKNLAEGIANSDGMKNLAEGIVRCAGIKNLTDGIAVYDGIEASKKTVVAIVRESNLALYGERRTFSVPDDTKGYAKRIYALLRAAEETADIIVCEEPDGNGSGGAVLNRLRKAENRK
ncbi:MAG: threonylcarbamoyl-AMP synthase [Clostridiales bacterium]|nr:threonylcarbamoyl-AMP synthase [Clostridiales bacterium]